MLCLLQNLFKEAEKNHVVKSIHLLNLIGIYQLFEFPAAAKINQNHTFAMQKNFFAIKILYYLSIYECYQKFLKDVLLPGLKNELTHQL